MKNKSDPKQGFFDKIVSAYDKLEQAGIIGWPVEATALAYYTLMGFIPFLALCFALARSFGLDIYLSDAITGYVNSFANLQEHAEIKTKILDMLGEFSDNLIANYSGSVMAFVALAVIFWSGYRVLTLLEAVFGKTYGYHPPRRPIHKIMDYVTVMGIIPLVLIAASFINAYLAALSRSGVVIPTLGIDLNYFVTALILISPYLVMWLILCWVYAYFSRGLMRWPERLIGGFISAMALMLFQTFYIKVMLAITSYNAIYGSFAAVPLFMIWLYASWLIVLSGGEVTRRISDYLIMKKHLFTLVDVPTWQKTIELSTKVMNEVINNYKQEPEGSTTSMRQLSRATGEPLPALGSVVNRLLNVKLLARVSGPATNGDEGGPCFVPSRCPEQIDEASIRKIIDNGMIDFF